MIKMNIQDRIIQLNLEHTGDKIEIGDVFLTIISKFQLFEPCLYLSEDEEWLNIALLSLENDKYSQSMSILKKEITAFGVFNREDIDVPIQPIASQDLYQ